MTTHRGASDPKSKLGKAQAALAELLSEATRKGFYGAATLTVSLQDGHIQHVKISTERMLR